MPKRRNMTMVKKSNKQSPRTPVGKPYNPKSFAEDTTGGLVVDEEYTKSIPVPKRKPRKK